MAVARHSTIGRDEDLDIDFDEDFDEYLDQELGEGDFE
jgi:hypothetical protein